MFPCDKNPSPKWRRTNRPHRRVIIRREKTSATQSFHPPRERRPVDLPLLSPSWLMFYDDGQQG